MYWTITEQYTFRVLPFLSLILSPFLPTSFHSVFLLFPIVHSSILFIARLNSLTSVTQMLHLNFQKPQYGIKVYEQKPYKYSSRLFPFKFLFLAVSILNSFHLSEIFFNPGSTLKLILLYITIKDHIVSGAFSKHS